METQDLPDATASKIDRYTLSDAERGAVGETKKQELALKAAMYELQEKLQQIVTMRNGILQLIAFQQGLAGNWTLTPDGSALVKE